MPSLTRMLPRLILIADRFTLPEVGVRAVRAAESGVPWILLRDRGADRESVESRAPELSDQLRSLPRPPLISITAEVKIARRLGLHLHVGARDLPLRAARRALSAETLLGFSAHAEEEAVAFAAESAPDYFFFSPIFPTRSKPEAEDVGLDALARFAHASGRIPVYALGGIEPSRVADCLDAGAHGVAVLSGILGADDVEHAAASYLARLEL